MAGTHRINKKIADSVKTQFEEKTDAKYSVFIAQAYKTQAVAGINYYISVLTDNEKKDVAFIKVFQPLPGQGEYLQLTGYLLNKTLDDGITMF